MENKSPEQGLPKIKVSDLKKIHKTTTSIASEISSEYKEYENTGQTQERRKLLRRIWEKLIPVEKKHHEELVKAVKEGEIDPLTGLPNRKTFIREMAEEVAFFKRASFENKKRSSTLLYIDVNNLREINNRDKSHAEGDEYLRKIALTFTEMLRPGDAVARIGGDEFGILLRGMSIVDIRDFWEKRLLPTLIQNGISVSVGAAPFNPDDVSTTMETADELMYDAKKVSHLHGDNTMKVYGENIR